jgi:hypothetical protein
VSITGVVAPMRRRFFHLGDHTMTSTADDHDENLDAACAALERYLLTHPEAA